MFYDIINQVKIVNWGRRSMYEDLTGKQVKIIEFILEEVKKRGYPPSVREICKAVGLKSTSSVHNHLVTLQDLGYIKRDATKPIAISYN